MWSKNFRPMCIWHLFYSHPSFTLTSLPSPVHLLSLSFWCFFFVQAVNGVLEEESSHGPVILRRRRAAAKEKNTCQLFIQTDHLFFKYYVTREAVIAQVCTHAQNMEIWLKSGSSFVWLADNVIMKQNNSVFQKWQPLMWQSLVSSLQRLFHCCICLTITFSADLQPCKGHRLHLPGNRLHGHPKHQLHG